MGRLGTRSSYNSSSGRDGSITDSASGLFAENTVRETYSCSNGSTRYGSCLNNTISLKSFYGGTRQRLDVLSRCIGRSNVGRRERTSRDRDGC